jgi:antitoxin component YwqK of YwqJK toxin-antitoxin module
MNTEEVRIEDSDPNWDWRDDALLYQRVPFSGVVFRTYSNGLCEFEFKYLDGLREGFQREYFDSGRMREEWHAERGAAHGNFKKWHENGQLKSTGNYEYGVELQYDEWDASGTLIKSRRIDKDSDLMKYVETMREHVST